MLVQTLERLGSDPWAWGSVAVAGGLAAGALVRYRRSRYLVREPQGNAASALAYLNRRVAAGPRYFLLMTAALVAAISGLAMIARDWQPSLGFFVLLGGILVLQTEPIRQRIRVAIARVVAAQTAERRIVAREALRDSYRNLVTAYLMIGLAVAAGLAAF